jgi:uncharacterized repeat protein (TIGR01451 family)
MKRVFPKQAAVRLKLTAITIGLAAMLGGTAMAAGMPAAGDQITSRATVSYTFEENGESHNGQTQSNDVTTVVAQVFGVQLDGGGTVSVVKGDETGVNFSVLNTGNGSDVYALKLTELKGVHSVGIALRSAGGISHKNMIQLKGKDNIEFTTDEIAVLIGKGGDDRQLQVWVRPSGSADATGKLVVISEGAKAAKIDVKDEKAFTVKEGTGKQTSFDIRPFVETARDKSKKTATLLQQIENRGAEDGWAVLDNEMLGGLTPADAKITVQDGGGEIADDAIHTLDASRKIVRLKDGKIGIYLAKGAHISYEFDVKVPHTTSHVYAKLFAGKEDTPGAIEVDDPTPRQTMKLTVDPMLTAGIGITQPDRIDEGRPRQKLEYIATIDNAEDIDDTLALVNPEQNFPSDTQVRVFASKDKATWTPANISQLKIDKAGASNGKLYLKFQVELPAASKFNSRNVDDLFIRYAVHSKNAPSTGILKERLQLDLGKVLLDGGLTIDVDGLGTLKGDKEADFDDAGKAEFLVTAKPGPRITATTKYSVSASGAHHAALQTVAASGDSCTDTPIDAIDVEPSTDAKFCVVATQTDGVTKSTTPETFDVTMDSDQLGKDTLKDLKAHYRWVEIAPSELAGSAAPGGVAKYTHALVNQGSRAVTGAQLVWGKGKTHIDPDWQVTYEPDLASINIAPGATLPLLVSVQVPVTAKPGPDAVKSLIKLKMQDREYSFADKTTVVYADGNPTLVVNKKQALQQICEANPPGDSAFATASVSVDPGSCVWYEILVNNNNSINKPATNVVIEDQLPAPDMVDASNVLTPTAEVSRTNGTTEPVSDVQIVDGKVVAKLGELKVGESVKLRYRIQIPKN